MSFQLAATAAKPNEVRKALEAQRDAQVAQLPEEFDDSPQGREAFARTERDADELGGDLVDAAIAAAEAAVKKLKGANSYQITAMGGTDPGDPGSQDATAPANQHLTISVRAF